MSRTTTHYLRSTFSVMPCAAEVTRGERKELHSFVCVTDLDEGMSVTNDIENVLAVLVDQGPLMPGMLVVYRDTDGVWDEVLIDEHCGFIKFHRLHAHTRDVAVSMVVNRLIAQGTIQ